MLEDQLTNLLYFATFINILLKFVHFSFFGHCHLWLFLCYNHEDGTVLRNGEAELRLSTRASVYKLEKDVFCFDYIAVDTNHIDAKTWSKTSFPCLQQPIRIVGPG